MLKFLSKLFSNTVYEKENTFAKKVAESIQVGNIVEFAKVESGCVLLKLNNGNYYIMQPHGYRNSDETIWKHE